VGGGEALTAPNRDELRGVLTVYFAANRDRLSPRRRPVRPSRPAWLRALPWLLAMAAEYAVALHLRWWPS
jgi:hypothetical protein